MPDSVNWSFPTSIRFGPGRINEIADACRATGMTRPLLITDRGLANLPLTKAALEIIDNAGLDCSVFSDVDPNPNDINLNAGIESFKIGNHDGVIAFGGGSGLDLGKLVAFQARQSRPVWDFEDIGDWWTRANSEVIAPIVAVPTTAGTGSEVGRAGVLTNTQTKTKKVIFHPKILPSIVICDPELTVGLPPTITVGTGMDAFIHCLEAFCSPTYHPLCQGIALEGMRLVKENLPRVWQNQSDIEARGHMMSAASMGATAFQKGLGAMHALSHPISAHYNTHHGMTNAVVMPAVLRFNRPAIEDRIAAVAAYLGIAGGFSGFMDYVLSLREALDVPNRVCEMGVLIRSIGDLAEAAVQDPCAAGNPVPLTVEAATSLYEECI